LESNFVCMFWFCLHIYLKAASFFVIFKIIFIKNISCFVFGSTSDMSLLVFRQYKIPTIESYVFYKRNKPSSVLFVPNIVIFLKVYPVILKAPN